MADEKHEEQPPASNTVSGETGQLDARFVLWRTFCGEFGIPVDTLPSELSGKAKERWEGLKDSELNRLKDSK